MAEPARSPNLGRRTKTMNSEDRAKSPSPNVLEDIQGPEQLSVVESGQGTKVSASEAQN